MKVAVLMLSILAWHHLCVYGQNGGSDELEIRRSIDEVGRAFVNRDPEPLDRIFREDYVNIRAKPVYNAKAHLLAMVKADAAAARAGRTVDLETLSYDSDNIIVRLHGPVAIVTSLKKNHWRFKADRCLTRYHSTEVWVRQGSWRVAAAHYTQQQCDNPPPNSLHPAVAAAGFLSAPRNSASKQMISEIMGVIGQLKPASSPELFAVDFVNTDLSGRVTDENAELLAALRSGLKDDEFFLDFGEAVVYGFQTRPRIGRATEGGVRQHSVIFIRNGAGWIAAAAHVSRPSE